MSTVRLLSLPIDFASFKGSYASNLNCEVFNWDASNTAGTLVFEVERSDDGTVFSKLDDEKLASSNDRSAYSYNDYSASSTKTYYYRIKQVEQTGQVSYTTVIKIMAAGKSILKLLQSSSLITVINLPTPGSYEYALMNGASNLVKKGILSGTDHSINIGSLVKGVFILTLTSSGENHTLRFIK